MDKVKLSWEDVEKLCDNIYKQLKKTEFIPDAIIAISKGGLIPGVILANEIGCDMAVIAVRNYKDDEQLDKIESNWHIATHRKFKRKENILIVDSVNDTGKTQKEVEDFIISLLPHNKYKVATLFYKTIENKKASVPDYFVETTTKWIVFPWK